MKNILTLLSLLVSISIYGQNKEAYINYGTHFLSTDINNFDPGINQKSIDFSSAPWPINQSTPERFNVPGIKKSFLLSRGIITAGYTVRKGRHNIGGFFMFEKQHMSHQTIPYVDTITANLPLLWSDSEIKNYHLAGRYDFNWLSREKLKLYSGVSFGVSMRKANTLYYDIEFIQARYPDEIIESFYRDKTTDNLYHLHANIIGVRYGHVWAIVAELGLGHRGYVNVGVNHLLFASEKWEKKRIEKAK